MIALNEHARPVMPLPPAAFAATEQTTFAAASGGIQSVQEVVSHYYPNLLLTVEACLSVIGSMALGGRTKPLSLILEGASGFGKTATVQMYFPLPDSQTEAFIYRSDKFTPKAFVTHAANVKAEELAKMDLLPKLKNKVLVTKELAPIFRGREEELKENFSTLISVLDGAGFTSDTGMRGQRGYQEKILFNWIGATTPLPAATHRLMSQLGTRLLFYEVPTMQPTEEELLRFAEAGNSADGEDRCQHAVNEFIERFFAQYPVGSVNPKELLFSERLLREVVRWAQLLVAARAEIRCEKNVYEWEPVSAMPPEAPWKVVNYFKELAIGHALVQGRKVVTATDLALVGHVAISSIPGHLRPIIRQLRSQPEMTSSDAARLCHVSAPSARRYLLELSLLGVCELEKGSAQTNAPDTLRLMPGYRWLNPNLER